MGGHCEVAHVNTGINFPSGTPFDKAGNLTPQWRMFFLTLFTRTGGEEGNDTNALQTAITLANANIADLQTESGAGDPVSDLAPVYAMIYAVEAIAAQAMAIAARQPDERGEAGEGVGVTHLSQRVAELEGQIEQYRADDALRLHIADLEAKIEAMSAPQIGDNSQLGNGAGYLVASNNLSDVANAATAAGNIGLGTSNNVTFNTATLTNGAAATAPTTSNYAGTFTRNATPTQYVGIGGSTGTNQIDSLSAVSNAKPLTFNSTTVVANTTPTAGSVGINWQILGVTKFTITQAGLTLVGTTTPDSSGNPFQVNGGISFSPATTMTAPSAGGAGALPATPTGYATVTIGGTARKIAYY